MKKLVLALIFCTAMLCGCSAKAGNEISETDITETSSVTVATESSAAVTEAETTATETAATAETTAVANNEQIEYSYSPPDAALDVEFARDNIICRVEYKDYPNDKTAELPEYIFSDMNNYAQKVIAENDILNKNSFVLEGIGVYMFDINSDGLDDYIVIGEIVENESMFYQPYIIEKLYIQDGNNGFQAIDFPASTAKYGIKDYILSTKTNGYNDFIGISVNGFFTAVYDGNSTYSEAEILDIDYMWEYLDNDFVKITIPAYNDEYKNKIAVAKFIFDTDCVEHMLLYSSLPDGTPSVSLPQTYGSNIFEFYVKRTDKAPEKWNDFWVGPIEIKYIPASSNDAEE